MRILIIGGHGRVARLMVPRLAARGDDVIATVRHPEQFTEVTRLGGQPFLADLEHAVPGDLLPAFAGTDAVVYAASSGDGTEEQLWAVDFGGVTTALVAAELTGVSRFVHISTLGADGPLPDYVGGPWWEAYFGAKTKADAALAASRLNWTSVRPGLLTDENPTGRIQVGDRLGYAPVTRADVADTIVAALTAPSTYRRAFDIVGGTRPIDEALASLR
ncbi:SDR family oxidoreductase [Streptomyces flaveolus]|uniref:SDR family oxidoreductase n=1 Tax=Streptomyces flaveolus TaxID=67297 RepID=UPI0036F6D7EE